MSRDEPCDPMNYRLPFVVGITGKRDLNGADDALDKAVAEYFREFHRNYPHTPILLLSSLASGADQVVAASVLRLRDDPEVRLEVSLVAPLPMPDRLYRDDFAGPDKEASLAEYERLKRAACRTIELPLLSDQSAVARPGMGNNDRNLQYLLAGVFIARRCHVLLAAWDFKKPRGMGGTAENVRFKRSGRLKLPEPWQSRFNEAEEPYGYPPHPIEVPETGPVLIFPLSGGGVGEPREVMPRPLIVSPVAPRPDEGRDAYFRRVREQRKEERKGYIKRFDRIHKGNLEDFNALAEKVEEDRARADQRDNESRGQLPVDERPRLPGSLPQLADVYATADRLALDLQARVNRLLIRGIAPIILAVIVFAAYAHLAAEPRKHGFLIAFLGLLAASYAIYLNSHPRSRDFLRRSGKHRRVPRHDDKNRYQDFRTLGEGLRVQLFWRLAGMPDFVSDYYLTRQKNEVDWIRVAISAWGILAEPASERTELVRRKWVVSQLGYYIRSSYRDRIGHLIFRQMAAGLIGSGVFTSVFLAIFHLWEDRHWDMWVFPRTSISIYGVILVVVVGILVLYATAKWRETQREIQEDEEEFRQNDTILGTLRKKWGEAEVAGLSPIPRSFLKLRYWPLRRLILWGRKAEGRPPVEGVAKGSLWFGFGLGLLITLGLMIVSLCLPKAEVLGPRAIFETKLVDWLIVAIALNAAFAALLQWYSEKQALGEQYRQYKRTKMTFLLAHEALEPKHAVQPSTPPARIFKDLGRESLAEHADWLLLRRERPLELAWPPA